MAKKLSRISPLEEAAAAAVGSSMMVSDDEDEREDIGNGNLKEESKLKADGYKGNEKECGPRATASSTGKSLLGRYAEVVSYK